MNQCDDNLELILYSIIVELSKEDAPIIFKGALALKELLYLNNHSIKIVRKTTDIDANWIDDYDEKRIINIIERAVKNVNYNYSVELVRLPDKNVSMGINILDENNIILSKIDMDIKDNPFYIICEVNDVNVKYSDINKMFSDKLMVISNDHVFRRIKDILDIYLIINNFKINRQCINSILEYDNKKLGSFKTMLGNKTLIKNGYDKLKGIDNKPDFEDIWNTIIDYLKKENYI